MITRILIAVVIFGMWLLFVIDEVRSMFGPRHIAGASVWPDAAPEPDAGQGGHFGRPDVGE